MIKQVIITAINDDTSDFPRAQVFYMGKEGLATRISPYGYCYMPPLDTWGVSWSMRSEESSKVVMFSELEKRLKELQPGEVGIHNPETGSYIKFKENGDIDIESQNNINVICVDATVIASGNMSSIVDGDLSFTVTGITEISSNGNMTLTAPQITLTGDIVLDGDVTGNASGSINAVNGLVTGGIEWSTHLHSQLPDSNGDAEVDTGVPHS